MTEPDDLSTWDITTDPRMPAAVIPVPASTGCRIRGRRVIIGVPGVGWRSDLRGDTPIVQASRTYVPVLPELEWYRAESEKTEVFAPLIPVERVWVETIGEPATAPPSGLDLVSRLVSLDTPPQRPPTAARDVVGLTGKRVIQVPGPEKKAAPDQRDLRATTEPFTGADGDICVRVAAELDWYRWAWNGQVPKTQAVPVHLLWAE